MPTPAHPRARRTPGDPEPRADTDAEHRRSLLRGEVGAFRAGESRRVFDTAVYVGELGGPRTGFVVRRADLASYDHGLRTDVVGGLLEHSPPQWQTVLVVRAGSTEPHDLDLHWFSAARTAFGSHDRRLESCYVVTRERLA